MALSTTLAISTPSPSSSSSSPTANKQFTANILPCRVLHNGKVNASRRYWNPIPLPTHSSTTNTQAQTHKPKQISHFRGRRLYGTPYAIPPNYRGVLLKKSDRKAASLSSLVGVERSVPGGVDHDDDEDAEIEVPALVMEEVGTFSDVVSWVHGEGDGESGGAEVERLGEWLRFAEAIHGFDAHPVGDEKN